MAAGTGLVALAHVSGYFHANDQLFKIWLDPLHAFTIPETVTISSEILFSEILFDRADTRRAISLAALFFNFQPFIVFPELSRA